MRWRNAVLISSITGCPSLLDPAKFMRDVALLMPDQPSIFRVFEQCVAARRSGQMIERENRQDKEFHFQNWFQARLNATGFNHEQGGRNTYPDFRMVASTEGYEVKGLAYPGREMNYDCNSQAPSGEHNGRTIYYVFGRYPAEPDGTRYPVLDLVICHGDFLNAHHDYVHKNKSVRGFGSYGDILIRDRKMYVAPTPFGVVDGLAHQATLIIPAGLAVPKGLVCVGDIVRREAAQLIIGYRFDLRINTLTAETVPNPGADREHGFQAWRLKGESSEGVRLRTKATKEPKIEVVADED